MELGHPHPPWLVKMALNVQSRMLWWTDIRIRWGEMSQMSEGPQKIVPPLPPEGHFPVQVSFENAFGLYGANNELNSLNCIIEGETVCHTLPRKRLLLAILGQEGFCVCVCVCAFAIVFLRMCVCVFVFGKLPGALHTGSNGAIAFTGALHGYADWWLQKGMCKKADPQNGGASFDFRSHQPEKGYRASTKTPSMSCGFNLR